MRLPLTKPLALATALASFVSTAAADQLLKSESLQTCQDDSGFTASLFNVVFTPNNNSATVEMDSVSSISGNVEFDLSIYAYGYQIIKKTISPCDIGLTGMCPMVAGKDSMTFNIDVPSSAIKDIPSIAYTMPDLDAYVQVFINLTSTGESVACVEANISNGKTVNLLGVKWATAIVAGLALASSAVISGLGHANAAAHVAANALSLFGYFQAQAIIGMTGVHLPPAVMAWTQDFQWSMGVIEVSFMQDIFTWYQRATGGTPATLFDSLTTVSVDVEKRSLKRSLKRGLPAVAKPTLDMFKRSVAKMPRSVVEKAASLVRRGNIENGSGSYVVYGIQRVAFKADIESTNLFMTCLVFFCIFVVLTVIGVLAFKGFCELAVKNKWMKSDKFLDFRNGWHTILKGILFRLTLIGFPGMTILCMWELTQRDSAAEVVLAIFFFLGILTTLAWAASKVIRIARRSVTMHRNPAYILFSDPQALNKWGFLYVQFRASAYYFIAPVLAYHLVKGMFIAFAQAEGTVQAIALILIEAGALIGASVLRPWMDKKTNSFNIAICSVNFLNAIFLLIFTDVFDQPGLVTGVVGVVFWIVNVIFSLVLLIVLIVTTIFVFLRENPDARYQAMADDRASFMKSQTHLTTTTELDALAATARGDKGGYKPGLDLDDDAESISSESLRHRGDLGSPHLASGAADSAGASSSSYREPPRSPVDPSVPLFPAESRTTSPPPYSGGYLRNQPSGSNPRAPSPFGGSVSNLSSGYRSQHNASPGGFRAQNNASPWQRGAGYDH